MKVRERKRGGEHKESARKVYNALKSVRHLLLHGKPVNLVVNVPVVPTPLPYSTEQKMTQTDTWVYRRTVSGSIPASLDCCHRSVPHTHTHTVCTDVYILHPHYHDIASIYCYYENNCVLRCSLKLQRFIVSLLTCMKQFCVAFLCMSENLVTQLIF